MNFADDIRATACQIEADVRSGAMVFKHGIPVTRDTEVVRARDGSGYSVAMK